MLVYLCARRSVTPVPCTLYDICQNPKGVGCPSTVLIHFGIGLVTTKLMWPSALSRCLPFSFFFFLLFRHTIQIATPKHPQSTKAAHITQTTTVSSAVSMSPAQVNTGRSKSQSFAVTVLQLQIQEIQRNSSILFVPKRKAPVDTPYLREKFSILYSYKRGLIRNSRVINSRWLAVSNPRKSSCKADLFFIPSIILPHAW